MIFAPHLRELLGDRARTETTARGALEVTAFARPGADAARFEMEYLLTVARRA